MALLDAVQFVASAGGTTDFGVGAAVVGYQTPASAGAANARTYGYRAENSSLTEWEVGIATYSTTGPTVARTTVIANHLGTTAKVNFTLAPNVGFVELRETSLSPDEDNTFTATQRAQLRKNISSGIKGRLFGLTLSASGPAIVAAAGEAADSTGIDLMVLTSSINKSTNAWAVGSTNGGLDTGTIANNTWYNIYVIKRPDTGVVDALISLSATSPTMPTNYTLFRRIGVMRTNGSASFIVFTQLGDRFYWAVGLADASSQAVVSATRTLITMSVPPNMVAFFRGYIFSSAATGILFQRTGEIDPTVGFSGAGLISLYTESASQGAAAEFVIPTDGSSQIAAKSVNGCTLNVTTYGWEDTRGRFS